MEKLAKFLFHYISTWVRRSDLAMKLKNVRRGREGTARDIKVSEKMNFEILFFKKQEFSNFFPALWRHYPSKYKSKISFNSTKLVS